MQAMKGKYAEIQENAYKKLALLGVSENRIQTFDDLIGGGFEADFIEFAGAMARYAVEIECLAKLTTLTEDQVWSSWEKALEACCEYTNASLDIAWTAFRETMQWR